MNNLQFRTATPDDAAQLQALVESAFRASDSREDWTADMRLNSSFRISVEEITAQITKPDGVILIAAAADNNDNDNANANDSDSGAVFVASIEVSSRKRTTNPDKPARLSMLAVSQHRQRGGIGRQMLSHAETYCTRTWGVRKLCLNALSTRRALISWYERRGYVRTGEVSPFPVGDARFKHLGLPDDLCFVELEKSLDG
ncbi:hypothetical protein MKZ38_002201 [Zalerion maritima]|uniref:N-acetyltransferase domain-containing protein n=1 Tax=Zalerion maritima TaxID=339359 RepID=A0AAD5WSN0_9PEZI|nr:hypothetical protein MKZ38_002201 [Zalerion maritima]